MSTNRVINAKDCAIRLARTDDLPLLREIFAAARAALIKNGFSERGEIRLADGAARLVYEKNGDE